MKPARKAARRRSKSATEPLAYQRGKQYRTEKQAHGAEPGGRGNQYTVVRGNESQKPCPLPKTAEKIAAVSGVSSRTIKNDANFAEAVDVLVADSAPMARLSAR